MIKNMHQHFHLRSYEKALNEMSWKLIESSVEDFEVPPFMYGGTDLHSNKFMVIKKHGSW